MNKKSKMFRGLSIDLCWIPLTATLIEANNMLQVITKSDIQYAVGMMKVKEILEPMYAKVMNKETLTRFMELFVYVLEWKRDKLFGAKVEGKMQSYVSAYDYFDLIKKYWNKDITKEINKFKQ